MKGILNFEQVNEEYGLKLTKDEFINVLVPAWLCVGDDPRLPKMSDDEFVGWYKRSKTNRRVAESMARMYHLYRDKDHDLQMANIKLYNLAVDDNLIKQLDEVERFVNTARNVLKLVKEAKKMESEVQK